MNEKRICELENEEIVQIVDSMDRQRDETEERKLRDINKVKKHYIQLFSVKWDIERRSNI